MPNNHSGDDALSAALVRALAGLDAIQRDLTAGRVSDERVITQVEDIRAELALARSERAELTERVTALESAAQAHGATMAAWQGWLGVAVALAGAIPGVIALLR